MKIMSVILADEYPLQVDIYVLQSQPIKPFHANIAERWQVIPDIFANRRQLISHTIVKCADALRLKKKSFACQKRYKGIVLISSCPQIYT